MKWVSLAFALVGALVLGVSGYLWQSFLGSSDMKLIMLLSQVRLGGEATDASSARAAWSGFSFLSTLPWFSYLGAALSAAGAVLVVLRGRVAAILLLAGPVLILLPLALVVRSIPELSPYLYAALVGVPSLLAGLAALTVRSQARTPAVPGAEPSIAEKNSDQGRHKQLWLGGVAVTALALLLLLVGLSGRGKESDGELYLHYGPVALWSYDLLDLSADPLQPGQLLAAEWDGAWFAAHVLSATSNGARVRFDGWEAEWDQDLSRDRLRSLPEHLVPARPKSSNLASAALGSPTASPCAFVLSFYQPEAGFGGVESLSKLPAKQTLYSSRLDLADVSLERALAGSPIQAKKPFALAAAGTLRVKVAGPHYFVASSNGTTRLWIDEQPVTADSPVQLDVGAHDLRVDHRHDGGSTLKLQLRMGRKADALRAVDLTRDGVAQFAPDEGGGVRIVLDEALLFDLDRDNLKPSAERALSSIYTRSIAPVPSATINIEGHTDASGTSLHNQDLSRRRAESVRGWLIQHGRSSTGLDIQAFGETRPRVPNDSDEHRRLNRRVELVIGPAATTDSERATAQVAVDAPAPTAAPVAVPAPPTTPAALAPGAQTQAVLDVLSAYYRELNDGNFDANRYFEPSVERYITMMNTSTDAMNNYIRNIFPKQFKQHHFELEEGSLSQESPGQYLYVEHSNYIQAGKTQSVEKRVKVRVRLSPAGKLVFFHQFQRL